MEKTTATAKKKTESIMSEVKTNPLRNEKIYVRFVPHENGFVGGNKQHVLYGGKADGATLSLCVPILRSTGNYKNILTNEEKDYLEEVLGLDDNALSVYKKTDNYWDNYRVSLTKEGIHLNLSDPEDFIRYKVLLANSDIIAPSVQERIERPKVTYQFELVRESEESTLENAKMDATMASYKEFGKIESDIDTMRVLVELLDARPYAINTKAEFLRARINTLIQKDPKVFLSNITDPLLHTKVIIRRAQELGKITKRADYYYLTADGSPLCDNGENPTLTIAANFLNQPAHQDIKFILESEVEKNRI
jgi:hypothetical protein